MHAKYYGSFQLSWKSTWVLNFYFDCACFIMQISEVEVVGKEEQMTAKDALLLWAKKVTQGYVTVKFSSMVTTHFLLYQLGESVANLGKGPRGPRPHYLLNQNRDPLRCWDISFHKERQVKRPRACPPLTVPEGLDSPTRQTSQWIKMTGVPDFNCTL